MSLLLASSIKAALLLGASSLGAVLLRRSPAAARHQIWALGVVGVLLLPLLSLALPSLSIGISDGNTADPVVATAILVTGGGVTSAGPPWPTWLALAWTIGALVVTLRFLRGHIAARGLWRTAQQSDAPAWSLALRDAAAALAVTRTIGIRRSARIGSPMTIGVLRPRVLLPAAADDWSPERLRAVLMHELGHVRRHDTLIQIGAQLACALYWWNPLAWLAAARLRSEREHACDDLVLGSGVLPSTYAADLLDVVRTISRDSTDHAGAVCMVDRSGTEARLRRILDPAAPRAPMGALFRFAARATILAVAVTLACTSASAVTPAPEASRGSLSIGTPWVEGPGEKLLFQAPATAPDRADDLALIAAEVNRHLGELQECYQRRLAVNPALSGTIVIHWVITKDGDVPDQCITKDTLADKEVVACLNKLIKDSRFSRPRGGAIDVSFPFVFQSPTSTNSAPPPTSTIGTPNTALQPGNSQVATP